MKHDNELLCFIKMIIVIVLYKILKNYYQKKKKKKKKKKKLKKNKILKFRQKLMHHGIHIQLYLINIDILIHLYLALHYMSSQIIIFHLTCIMLIN